MAEDIYNNNRCFSSPLSTCTKESLKIVTSNYVINCKVVLLDEIGKKVRALKVKLFSPRADQYKPKRDRKANVEEMKELEERKDSYLTALDLLNDPMTHTTAEVVVERGFSNIKLITTSKDKSRSWQP